jgi:hypothetical protein
MHRAKEESVSLEGLFPPRIDDGEVLFGCAATHLVSADDIKEKRTSRSRDCRPESWDARRECIASQTCIEYSP